MHQINGNTYYCDEDGNRLGSDVGLLPISLRENMKITIHGYSGEFLVVNWSYHKGHPDEDAGLKIILRKN